MLCIDSSHVRRQPCPATREAEAELPTHDTRRSTPVLGGVRKVQNSVPCADYKVVGMFRRLFPYLWTLAMLVAAPAASAAVTTLGSDLKAPADVVEAHGADSAFWNVALLSGGHTAAPVGGQVTSVRIKGIVLNDPTGRTKPRTMIHFQTLQPQGDGTMKVL